MTTADTIAYTLPAVTAVLNETDRTRKAALMQCLAQQFRITVLDILHDRQTGHWGGASSAAELLTGLYFDAMNIRPEQPDWPDRDRIVISKGHASCMIYTVLAHRGYFPVEELCTFRKLGSRLQGHPNMKTTPGVEMSTGSLGHGLSVTLGMALAARLLNKSYWSYVLLGDGDLNEGQTWEAVMAAAKYKPERMAVLVDYNKVQLDGPSHEIMPMDPLADKFRAFNWNVAPRLYDGHDMNQVLESYDWIHRQTDWPVAVVYATHKGRGISFMEDQALWHGAPVDAESYRKGRAELLETLRALQEAL